MIRSDMVGRLRGQYRVPITDGFGPAGGEEPDNPHEFVRTFSVPPIQEEAADVIVALRAEIARLVREIDALRAGRQITTVEFRDGEPT